MSDSSVARSADQFFDGYAHDFDAIYGGDNRGTIGRFLDRILRKSMLLRYELTIDGCAPIQGKSVLDIGCGPGHYSVALAAKGAGRVIGLDFSKSMLGVAAEHAKAAGVADKCEFVLEDVLKYRAARPFDYVIVMGVMDYVKDPELFVRHILTLTSGKAFFSFPKAGGLLALIRSYRYRNRTPLFLYGEEQLKKIFSTVCPGRFSIRSIARDFFVEVENEPG